DQFGGEGRVVGAVEVEDDRLLAPVVLPEEERRLGPRLVAVEGPDAAGDVAGRRLDLDDLGAEPGQEQPGVLGLLVGDLDDPDSVEDPDVGVHGPNSTSTKALTTSRPAWNHGSVARHRVAGVGDIGPGELKRVEIGDVALC